MRDSHNLLNAEISTSTAGPLTHVSLMGHPERSTKEGPASTHSTTTEPIARDLMSSYGKELRVPRLLQDIQPQTTPMHHTLSAIEVDAVRALLGLSRLAGRFDGGSQEQAELGSKIASIDATHKCRKWF